MNETGGDDRADSSDDDHGDNHGDNHWAEDFLPEGEPPEDSVSEEYDAEDYLPEDTEPLGDEEVHTALPGKVEAWRRRSATGAVLTGFALGLQQVFEPKKNEPSIIMQTSGEPPKDLPVEADFEYGRPRSSVVNIRPWLLPGDGQADESQAGNQAGNDVSGNAGNDGAVNDGARNDGAANDGAGNDHASNDGGHQEEPES